MNTPAANLYTAAQLAAPIGVTPQAIKERLGRAGVAPSGVVRVRGVQAHGWAIAALPQSLCDELAGAAKKRGVPSIEALLEDPPKRWSAPVPWHRLPAEVQAQATLLRDTFAPVMARQHEISGADLIDQASAFCRQHGVGELSADRIRYVMDRATRRDNGFQEWHRPELYLDDASFRPASGEAPGVPSPQSVNLEPVAQVFASLENKSCPTKEDRARLLHQAFVSYETAAGLDAPRCRYHAVKKAIITYLLQAVPGLYRAHVGTEEMPGRDMLALRRLFNRTLNHWQRNGRTRECLRDLRPEKSGNRLAVDFTADIELCRNEAVKRDGNLELAHRENYPRLSEAWRERYANVKGRLPKILRKALPSEKLAALVDEYRSPRRAAMSGPYIRGDWSDTEPGDWFVADDMTGNSKLHQLPEVSRIGDGGRLEIFRPEGLFIMDRRSRRFLHFLLINGHYNSRHVLRLLKETHDRLHGLSRIGLKTENGIWSCRFVVGDALERKRYGKPLFLNDALDGFSRRGWQLETPTSETGLNHPDLGMQISRAKPANPTGKADIECSFGKIQQRMRTDPSFVGFNERQDRMDRNQKIVRDFKRRVQNGDEHPGNEVPTLEQFAAHLGKVIDTYNAEAQNGTLEGRSPDDWWNEAILHKPLRQLPEEIAALLVTHEKSVEVSRRGIVIRTPGCTQPRPFADTWLSDFIGEQVAVRYCVDHPEVIWVRHPESGVLIKMEENALPATTAWTAHRDKAEAVNGRIAGFRKHAKVVSGEIRQEIKSSQLRDGDFSEAGRRDGREMAEAIAAHEQEKTQRQRKLTNARRAAAVLGGGAADPRNPERVIEAARWKQEILNRRAKKQQTVTNPETTA